MSSSEHELRLTCARDVEPFGSLRGGERVPGSSWIVRRTVGRGGMGEVFEVEHEDLGKRAAIKMLHPRFFGRADKAARLREEARRLARLRHPNLVEVFDLGATPDGRPYFVMELLEGRDLRAELARAGALPFDVALDLVSRALDGLDVAHAEGLVHRDVKLANLFLCDDGGLKVLDFGVAKALGEGESRTLEGVVLGTPRTMAPEQCSSSPVDARTDVYAAGLVLYELVAGRGPFDELRGNAEALRWAHCARDPRPPSSLAPSSVPSGVDAAVLRAIAKSPSDRFQSAREMAAELRRLRPGREVEVASRRDAKEPRREASLLHRAVAKGALAFARTILDDSL